MATGWEVDTDDGAEILDDGPCYYGDGVPGEIGCGGEDADVFEADDARDAGAVVGTVSVASPGEKKGGGGKYVKRKLTTTR